jgi:hypothetical protein
LCSFVWFSPCFPLVFLLVIFFLSTIFSCFQLL